MCTMNGDDFNPRLDSPSSRSPKSFNNFPNLSFRHLLRGRVILIPRVRARSFHGRSATTVFLGDGLQT